MATLDIDKKRKHIQFTLDTVRKGRNMDMLPSENQSETKYGDLGEDPV